MLAAAFASESDADASQVLGIVAALDEVSVLGVSLLVKSFPAVSPSSFESFPDLSSSDFDVFILKFGITIFFLCFRKTLLITP